MITPAQVAPVAILLTLASALHFAPTANAQSGTGWAAGDYAFKQQQARKAKEAAPKPADKK